MVHLVDRIPIPFGLLEWGCCCYSDESLSSITKVVNLFLDGKCPNVLGEYIASAPLTPLVKLGGGIRPIVVGTVWRQLVSKVSAVMIGKFMCGYLDDLQFGVGVSGGSETILHVVNCLIKDRGDDVGFSMLLVDFKNAFKLVDREAWYLDDGTIIRDTLVVGKALDLIIKEGPSCGLHLNVDKTKVFLPKEDPRSRLAERIVTASGPGFGDWQWRLSTLPFSFRVLGVYSASSGNTFHDALCMFNAKMETDILSNPSIPLFSVSKPCSTCSMIFAGDIYGDHVVSCAGIIGIKHRHNILHDTLVDICYRYEILAGKEVDIGLDGGRDKPLPIGYGFLSFSFSSLGELEADAVTLLKQIRKFFMAQDIGARVAAHIFNRISFAIAKGVGT
nr:hypothetical protein [Tanacetum cinerariifolium]